MYTAHQLQLSAGRAPAAPEPDAPFALAVRLTLGIMACFIAGPLMLVCWVGIS